MPYTRLLKGTVIACFAASLLLLVIINLHLGHINPTQQDYSQIAFHIGWFMLLGAFALALWSFPRDAEDDSKAPTRFAVIALSLLVIAGGLDAGRWYLSTVVRDALKDISGETDARLAMHYQLGLRLRLESDAYQTGTDWRDIAQERDYDFKERFMSGDMIDVSFFDHDNAKVKVNGLNHDSCAYLAKSVFDDHRIPSAGPIKEGGHDIWQPHAFRINDSEWLGAQDDLSEDDYRQACENDGHDRIESATLEIEYKKVFKKF